MTVRSDVARILQFMGYAPDLDFVAFASKGTTFLKWLSQSPQPDEKAIDAAALELEVAQQAEVVKVAESTTARDDAKRALTALDTIIANIDGATLVQAKAAIKQLAQIQRHIILATLGR